MQKPNKPTFAVFFSVNPNEFSVRRFAILRRFLTSEPESGINVIDYASLTFGFYKFIVIAEADSCKLIESALEHCRGIVEPTIVSVAQIEKCAPSSELRYAVLVKKDETKNEYFTRNPANLCAAVKLQTQADFETDQPYSSILLLESPSASQARQYGEYLYPKSHIFVTETNAPESLFNETEPFSPKTEPVPTALIENNAFAADFTIFNEGASAVNFVSETVNPSGPATTDDYYNFFKSMQQIQPQSSISLDKACYLWSSPSGSFNMTWLYHYGVVTLPVGGYEVHGNQPYSMQCNALPPKLYAQYTPNTTLGFNIANSDGFHNRTAQYFWLNDLINTTKYDLDFPENSYTGNDLAAYNYFVSQLNGVAPNTGTVASSLVQSVFDKGCPSNLDKTSFDNVGAHLVKECSYFETADKWFGLNGIFSVINTQVSIVSANELTAAAALMQIQPTSNVMTTLDSFFSILEAFVGMIPFAGSYIQGAITIGWTMAKMGMGPGIGNAPIEESIANMANKINTYLNNMQAANIQIHQTIMKNWGKLQTFTDGTMGNNAMISENQFDITYTGNGNVQLPQSYIDAAAKAWRLTVYQTLFAGFHTPQCNMSLQGGKPTNNPWNPDAGNYEYIYYLDTVLYDSNANPYAGFMEFDCRTDAPTQVLQILFGSNSDFNLNPLEFFTGINGWTAQNVYDEGNLGNFDSQQNFTAPNIPALGILV